MSLVKAAVLPATIGVGSHVLYFNHGEHHMWAPFYLSTFTACFVGGVVVLTQVKGYLAWNALALTSTVLCSYLFGTILSLLVYRLFLSPLNKFPGPWQAKISELWLHSRLTGGSVYYEHQRLHQKYGKYVRIGSNVLSISDPNILEVAFSNKTKVRKAEWYDLAAPQVSLHTTRDRVLHDKRRRLWAPAFSDKALKAYEPRVKHFNDKLVQRLRENAGKPIDMSKWFMLYAFDVMGRLAFGKDYGMLDSGKKHWALQLLTDGMSAANTRPPIWLFRILLLIPFALDALYKFLKFCKGELETRIKQGESEEDITGWLLKSYQGSSQPAEDPMFQGDSRLIIVAGSDTTASTLTCLCYELAKKPHYIIKLREELNSFIKGKANWSHTDIANAPYLNACIDEALRLHPPVPSGVERVTPPEGCQVGDIHIPGNTNFWTPQFVIGRDEDNYDKATEFVPERWTDRPEMVKHKTAFAPFSLGPEGCIGKNLAYLEMRTLMAQIVLEFDIALAPGEDGHKMLYESIDHFTVSLSPLELVFTPVS